MADLVITPADLELASSRSRPSTVQAGEAIEAGELVYRDTTTGKYLLASASAEASAAIEGIAVTAAGVDGYFSMLSSTSLILGATLTQGTPYFLSTNSGKIAPFADIGAGDYVSLLGFASSTSVIQLDILATGISI